MRRLTVNGIIAALVAAAGLSIGVAHTFDQRGPGPGGPGFGGRGLTGLARFADLTDAQRQQVEAILKEARESREGPPAAMTLHRQLQAEILADTPDEQKIDALRQELLKAEADALAHQINIERRIAQVLTPEQRAKARERLAEAPRGRGVRGPGRPGGGSRFSNRPELG